MFNKHHSDTRYYTVNPLKETITFHSVGKPLKYHTDTVKMLKDKYPTWTFIYEYKN